MNNKIEKFLPLGSVVLLNGATKRLMITGFCPIDEANEAYDYCGCVFPEGVLSSDETALFNHSQIDKIYFMGLNDKEEKEFKIKLNSLVAQMMQATVQIPQNISTGSPVDPALPGAVNPVNPEKQATTSQTATTINNFKFDE